MTNPFPQLTSLSAVSSDAYVQAEAYIMELLKERFPAYSFGYGTAMYWHIVVPAAAALAAMETNAANMGSSLSLKWIRDNAATVDEALAEAVLANYYQTLQAGSVATGIVAIVVSEQAPYSIAAGTILTANGVSYETTVAIAAQTTAAAVLDENDRLLTPRSDGTWQFLVPVRSVDAGVATFLPLGSVLSVASPPSNFVTAIAAGDISGGSNDQTVKDIAATLPQSFAAQTFGGAPEVSALVAGAFPGTKTAVLGLGDPEQWRDTHNLLQVQTGGMVDLYEVTQSSIASKKIEVTATLQSVSAKTWQFNLPRADAAGVYAVIAVNPVGDTRPTMPIVSTDRTISIPSTGYRPLIEVPAEAAFSAYQAMTVAFQDTYGDHTGLSVGATRSYDVVVLYMPLIQEISDFLVNGRLTKADNVLVRGAVPCVTRIALGIRLLDSDSLSDEDIASMKTAIVNKVAERGFGYGVLSSSVIVDAVHDYISGRSDVGANTVSLRGDIYAPTGEVMVLEGAEIRIPNEPSKMVSKNNTVFLTDVSRIDIAFLPVEAA